MGCVSAQTRISYLMSVVAMCCGSWRLLCVGLGMFPGHQPFSFNRLGFSAPKEACSKNVRTSGTLKFWYEGIFKIILSHGPIG